MCGLFRRLSFAGETKNVKRQFLFAFSEIVWYTDKVFAPETCVEIGVKADGKSAFCT